MQVRMTMRDGMATALRDVRKGDVNGLSAYVCVHTTGNKGKGEARTHSRCGRSRHDGISKLQQTETRDLPRTQHPIAFVAPFDGSGFLPAQANRISGRPRAFFNAAMIEIDFLSIAACKNIDWSIKPAAISLTIN